MSSDAEIHHGLYKFMAGTEAIEGPRLLSFLCCL